MCQLKKRLCKVEIKMLRSIHRQLYRPSKCGLFKMGIKTQVKFYQPATMASFSSEARDVDYTKFMETFARAREALITATRAEPELNFCLSWFEKVLDYNVKDGKMIRGLIVPKTFDILTRIQSGSRAGPVTEEDHERARISGWTVEFLQAFYLVSDDVMDHSLTRRGKPCWYQTEEVGLIAFNDAELIKSALYTLMKIYLREKRFYTEMLELLLETTRQTNFGQCLDLTTPGDFSAISLERQQAIVKYKTSYYTFCLPARLGLYLADIGEPLAHRRTEDILLEVGQLFQAQDDYIDCFGDPRVTGKVGTDIEEGKCTWLIANSINLAQPHQLQILRENYGKSEPEAVGRVKAVYLEIGLKDFFKTFEEETFNRIQEQISRATTDTKLPQEMFHTILEKVYKRSK